MPRSGYGLLCRQASAEESKHVGQLIVALNKFNDNTTNDNGVDIISRHLLVRQHCLFPEFFWSVMTV